MKREKPILDEEPKLEIRNSRLVKRKPDPGCWKGKHVYATVILGKPNISVILSGSEESTFLFSISFTLEKQILDPGERPRLEIREGKRSGHLHP